MLQDVAHGWAEVIFRVNCKIIKDGKYPSDATTFEIIQRMLTHASYNEICTYPVPPVASIIAVCLAVELLLHLRSDATFYPSHLTLLILGQFTHCGQDREICEE